MMPSRKPLVNGMAVSFVFLFLFSLVQNVRAESTITGTVYDRQRNPLPDIEVELLDDFYRSVRGGRTRTDGAGRYQFVNLRDGNYTIKVYAFRYDLEDQSIPLEVHTQNIRGGEGVGFFQQDFYLQPKKGGLAETEIGIVFAQEIPPVAKKAFDQAIKDLSEKRNSAGIDGLSEAIKLFPNYFQALYRLGKEMVIIRNYQAAIPYFYKAVEVNPKSPTTFYYLGYSLQNLGKDYNKAARTAVLAAHNLAPSSVQVLYVLGTLDRAEGDYIDAEKHLLQAKKLAKSSIPEIHKELAQLYGNDLKKYKEAADELELYLKASKLPESEAAKTKKIINNLREKAKAKSSDS